MEHLNGYERLLPRVRGHETNRELVWQVELAATDRVKLSLDGRVLTVHVVHPSAEGPNLGVHPDSAAV